MDRIFPYFDVAEDFLGLLRSWHEDAVTDETLKKLRLILVHSTEVYIPLDIKQSPFNVGVSIELPEFDLEQIQELANRYNLSFKTEEIKKISSILGGHPYLISLAFYHITCKNLSLEEILKQAPSDLGIYKEHLQRYLNDLEETPKLAAAMKKTIKEKSPVQLERQEKFKLLSMGLIKLKDNGVIPSCELYRQYFENQLDNF